MQRCPVWVNRVISVVGQLLPVSLEADIVMTGQPRPVLLVYAAAAFKEAYVRLPLLKATSRHLQTSNCRRVIHRA